VRCIGTRHAILKEDVEGITKTRRSKVLQIWKKVKRKEQNKKVKRKANALCGVGRVLESRGLDERLFDASRVNEPVEDGDRTGLVVGTRSSSTSEGLLTDNSTSALVVDVEVTWRGPRAERVKVSTGA
jgi:hypothetical protein